jgi:hypothetical protein
VRKIIHYEFGDYFDCGHSLAWQFEDTGLCIICDKEEIEKIIKNRKKGE